MMRLFAALPLLALFSCSQVSHPKPVDTEARMRHGIVPVDHEMSEKPIAEKLDQGLVEQGRVLYKADCLRCHGAEGRGDGPEAKLLNLHAANLRATVQEVRNFRFYLSISRWQATMPGWKTPYSEADLEALTAYLKTFRR
jgi:mono/diheme cytochrome c family protein